MTTDSYSAAVRPLLLTAAWFTLLACAAFAWATFEKPPSRHASEQTTLASR